MAKVKLELPFRQWKSKDTSRDDFLHDVGVLDEAFKRLKVRRIWDGFRCTDYPYESAATPPDCPETCETCGEQYVPVMLRFMQEHCKVSFYSDDEAAAAITDLIKSNKDHLDHVRAKIDEYGDIITRRWRRQSVAKRADLVRAMRPKMYPTKDTRMELSQGGIKYTAEILHRKEKKPKGDALVDAEVMPYLNIETLSEDPMLLLALLHHRTHYDPADWFHFDRQQLQLVFHVGGLLDVMYNPHCVHTYGENFGTLVQWEYDASHNGEMIGFPLAHQVFNAQLRVSAFLRDFVDRILHDNTEHTTKRRGDWDDLVADAFKPRGTHIAVSPYQNQAFSPPPKFDSRLILDIVHSRYRAAEDELAQIQTDPAYFRRLLQDAKASTSKTSSSEKDSTHSMSLVPFRAIVRFVAWRVVQLQLEEFLLAESQHDENISLGCKLPPVYEDALQCLEETLRAQLDALVDSISQLSCSLPSFRNGNTYMPANIAQESVPSMEQYRKDKLFWCINQLLTNTKHCPGRLPPLYLSFLDRVLSKASSKEKGRISQYLYDTLADMAAIDEVLSIISYHRPRRGPVLECLRAHTDRPVSTTSVLLEILPRIFAYSSSETEHFVESINSFMRLPVPNLVRPRREYLETNWNLRDALRRLWKQSHFLMQTALSGREHCEDLRSILSESAEISTRTCYLEMFEQEDSAMLKAVEASEARLAANVANSEQSAEDFIPIIEDTTTEASFQRQEPKVKIKTRPATTRQPEDTVDRGPNLGDTRASNHTSSSPLSIAVNACTLDLFARMYSRSEPRKTKTRWDELVAGLVDAGFYATHSGGSAVTFEDKTKGSIVLHQPHPDSTVDMVMLRLIGKRLTRWFGWDLDTFVKREKKRVADTKEGMNKGVAWMWYDEMSIEVGTT